MSASRPDYRMTQCAECRQIQEARKEDPELERVLGNAQTQDEVSAKMEEHLQSDPEPTLLQPKLGSTERMRVLFRAYDPAMTYVRSPPRSLRSRVVLSTDWDVKTSTARGLLLVPTVMHAIACYPAATLHAQQRTERSDMHLALAVIQSDRCRCGSSCTRRRARRSCKSLTRSSWPGSQLGVAVDTMQPICRCVPFDIHYASSTHISHVLSFADSS